MYQTCILIASQDTCIPHVSPACILHFRYMPLLMHVRHMYPIMYPECISDISLMYPDCL